MDVDFCSRDDRDGTLFQRSITTESKDTEIIQNFVYQKPTDEEPASSLEKRYVLIIEQSNDETDDDSSLFSFSMIDSSQSIQKDEAITTSFSENDKLLSNSNDFCRYNETDVKTCYFHCTNEVDSYAQNATKIGKTCPSEEKNNVLGNQDAESRRLLEIEILDVNKNLKESSEAGERTCCKEWLPQTAIELIESMNDYEYVSDASTVKNELFASSKQGNKVLECSDSEKVQNDSDSSDHCTTCSCNILNLSTFNNEFPSHSFRPSITCNIEDGLRMNIDTLLVKKNLMDWDSNKKSNDYGLSKLQKSFKTSKDERVALESVVQNLPEKLKLNNSSTQKSEKKVKTAIRLIEGGDEFIDEFIESVFIKTEIESDDTDQDSSVDILHFMLLKEIWSNRKPFDFGKSDLEKDEIFIYLLKEFLTKRNSYKYIFQLTGIDQFLKDHNICVAKESFEDNIEFGKFHRSENDTFSGGSLSARSLAKPVHNFESCETKPKINKQDEKFDGKSDFAQSILTRNETVRLKLEMRNVADQKTANAKSEQHMTASLANVSNVTKSRCGENSRHETPVKDSSKCSRHNMPLSNIKEMSNNSIVSNVGCPSFAYDFNNCERLRHFQDLCLQPFVKLEKINLQHLASVKQRTNTTVLKHKNWITRGKSVSRCKGVLKTDEKKRKSSKIRRRRSVRIAAQLRRNEIAQQESRSLRRRKNISSKNYDDDLETKRAIQKPKFVRVEDEPENNMYENQICKTDLRRRSKRLTVPKLCFVSLTQIDQSIAKPKNITQILDENTKNDSRSTEKIARRKRAHCSDTPIVQNHKKPDQHFIQNIKRRAKATCPHSHKEKLQTDEPFSMFPTNADCETTLGSEQCTNQHSPESVAIEKKRGTPKGKDPVKMTPKWKNPVKKTLKVDKSLTKGTRTMQTSLYFRRQAKGYNQINDIYEDKNYEDSKNPSGISKQNIQFKNGEPQEGSTIRKIENVNITNKASLLSKSLLTINSQQIEGEKPLSSENIDSEALTSKRRLSQNRDNKKDLETPIKLNKTMEKILVENEVVQKGQGVEKNMHYERYKLYFTNFLASNGHKVKFRYLNRRIALLTADIKNVEAAESFVKAFAQFDCANYLPWRDSEREKYILHRTWLCGTNGPQDPHMLYQSLFCQARIHISIERFTNKELNAHVLIYVDHSHRSMSKKKKS